MKTIAPNHSRVTPAAPFFARRAGRGRHLGRIQASAQQPFSRPESEMNSCLQQYRSVTNNLTALRNLRSQVASIAADRQTNDPITHGENRARTMLVATTQLTEGLEFIEGGGEPEAPMAFLRGMQEAATALGVEVPLSQDQWERLQKSFHENELQAMVKSLTSAVDLMEGQRILNKMTDYAATHGLEFPISKEETAARKELLKFRTERQFAEQLRGARDLPTFERHEKMAHDAVELQGISEPIDGAESYIRKTFFKADQLEKKLDQVRSSLTIDQFESHAAHLKGLASRLGFDNPLTDDEARARRFALSFKELQQAVDHVHKITDNFAEVQSAVARVEILARKIGFEPPVSRKDLEQLNQRVGQHILNKAREVVDDPYLFKSHYLAELEAAQHYLGIDEPLMSADEIQVRETFITMNHIYKLAEEVRNLDKGLSVFLERKRRLGREAEKFGVTNPLSKGELELLELRAARLECEHFAKLAAESDNENKEVWIELRRLIIEDYNFTDLMDGPS